MGAYINIDNKVLDSIVDSDMQVPPTRNFFMKYPGKKSTMTILSENLLLTRASFVNDCPSNDFNIDDVGEIYGQPLN